MKNSHEQLSYLENLKQYSKDTKLQVKISSSTKKTFHQYFRTNSKWHVTRRHLTIKRCAQGIKKVI